LIEPPPVVGAVQVTCASWSAATTVGVPGAPGNSRVAELVSGDGAAVGVTGEGAKARADRPALYTAVTATMYARPGARAVIVHVVGAPDVHVGVADVGERLEGIDEPATA
jgi:hypothetical protein